MSEIEAPKIEFPCKYPIKVMGEHDEQFSDEILVIIKKHAPDLLEETIAYQSSKNGKYLSVKVTIIATGIDQLSAMFEDLKSHDNVRMVL